MKPAYELADVLQTHWSAVQHSGLYNTWQLRTMDAVRRCRTASLGGHIDGCSSCGLLRISYNSCRNRHCPKCQGRQREECLPDWSFRRGYRQEKKSYCPCLISMLYLRCPIPSTSYACTNLRHCITCYLLRHGVSSILLATMINGWVHRRG